MTFRTDIWTLTLADGACRKLTGSGGTSTAPHGRPMARQIAYLGHQEGEGEAAMTRLWTVAADGDSAPICRSADFDRDLGNSTLTDQTLPGGHEGPVWSPDGRSTPGVGQRRRHDEPAPLRAWTAPRRKPSSAASGS